MSVTTYVDVSHHDWNRHGGQLDWARVRAATSSVMCARATYGDPQSYNPPSPRFPDFMRGALDAGIDVRGGYHNLISGDQASINRQVDYLRRTLDTSSAEWAMLDVERYEELVANGRWPRFEDVRQFVDRWHAVDERVLTVYLPQWIWSGHLGRPDLRVLGCPLVASNYGSNPNGTPTQVYAARGGDKGAGWAAYGGVTPTIWQFGSNVDCPGASGQTDGNAFRGSEAQLRALLTGGNDDMPTAQEIADAVLGTEIIAQDGTKAPVKVFLANTFMRVVGVQYATIRMEKVLGEYATTQGELTPETIAQIRQQVDEELAEANIPQSVVDALGAGDDDAETANLIRELLGPRLPGVLAELQRTDAAATQPGS